MKIPPKVCYFFNTNCLPDLCLQNIHRYSLLFMQATYYACFWYKIFSFIQNWQIITRKMEILITNIKSIILLFSVIQKEYEQDVKIMIWWLNCTITELRHNLCCKIIGTFPKEFLCWMINMLYFHILLYN